MFVISIIYWRCPVCGRKFPIRHGAVDRAAHCPYYGSKIRYYSNTYEYYNGD